MTAVTGGSAGLLSSYNSVGSLSGATALNTIAVPAPGWYDVEVWAWNAGTTGAAGTDDGNVALYSDPVTAASYVLQTYVAWQSLKDLVSDPAPFPFKIRVYAQANISLKSIGSGTSGVVVVSILLARASAQGELT